MTVRAHLVSELLLGLLQVLLLRERHERLLRRAVRLAPHRVVLHHLKVGDVLHLLLLVTAALAASAFEQPRAAHRGEHAADNLAPGDREEVRERRACVRVEKQGETTGGGKIERRGGTLLSFCVPGRDARARATRR